MYQGYDEDKQKYVARTIHIYNILYVHLDINLSTFQAYIEERFKNMKNNGVQVSNNEDTSYKVKLTEHGKELFKLRYLERPNPLPESEEDKSIYYFNCSKMQFKSYFAPFRKDVIVLEPRDMIEEILQEYMDAIDIYKGD